MICPNCHHMNASDAVECNDCGAALASPAQRCVNGHPMDPTWSECNYCRAENRLGSGASIPYRPTTPDAVPPPPPPPDSRKTTPEGLLPPAGGGARSGAGAGSPAQKSPEASAGAAGGAGGSSSRKTTFYAADAPIVAGGKPVGPKVIGVLVSYTWKPEGEIFPVREGRNRIGRDPQQCDICVPQDDSMSAIHSSISFRTRFVISDRDSKGGTYVNGEAVEVEAFPLDNYAEIRTGSTVWTFVVVHKKDDGTTA